MIEKYAPAKKPDEELPVALVELHEKIQAKQDEKAQEYLASIPVDEDGCYDFSHGTTDELPELTEQEYLRLKFPDALFLLISSCSWLPSWRGSPICGAINNFSRIPPRLPPFVPLCLFPLRFLIKSLSCPVHPFYNIYYQFFIIIIIMIFKL